MLLVDNEEIAMKSMQIRNKQQGFTIIELVVVILLLGILTATALPRFMDVTDEAHLAVVDGVEGGLATGVALYRAHWFAAKQPDSIPEYSGNNASRNGWPIGNDPTGTFTRTNAFGEDYADGVDDCTLLFTGLLQASGRPEIVGVEDTELGNFGRDETSNKFVSYDGSSTALDSAADFNIVFDAAGQTYDEDGTTGDFQDVTSVLDPAGNLVDEYYTGPEYCDAVGGDYDDGTSPGTSGTKGCDVNGNGVFDDGEASVANAGYCDYIYTAQYQDNNVGDIPVIRYTPSSGLVERVTYSLAE